MSAFTRRGSFLAATLLVSAPFLIAQANTIAVSHAWARATPPGTSVGAAYLEIHNLGQSDELLGATSDVARTVEMHESRMQNGVMEMRPIDGLAIAAGGHVRFEPEGKHFMLIGLKRPLTEGARFTLALKFRRAGVVQTTVLVAPLGATDAPAR